MKRGVRATSGRVRAVDDAARVLVTVGGVGVIAAVLVVMVYLVLNVWPLLRGGRAVTHTAMPLQSKQVQRASPPASRVPTATPPAAGAEARLTGESHHTVDGAVDLSIDEYRGLAVLVLGDGRFQPVAVVNDTATMMPIIDGGDKSAPVCALSRFADNGTIALARRDGTVQLATLVFNADFLDPTSIDSSTPDGTAIAALDAGERAALSDGYAEKTPQNQIRRITAGVKYAAPATLGERPIARVDFRVTAGAQYLVAQFDDGAVAASVVTITKPLGGGKPRTKLQPIPVVYQAPSGLARVADTIAVTGDGANVLLLWNNGTVQRYAKLNDTFTLMEQTTLLDAGRRVTASAMLLGGKTLLVGDDRGTVTAAFVAQSNTMTTPDGWRLVAAHRFDESAMPIRAIAPAWRDRTVAVLDDAGTLSLRHVTSHKRVAVVPGAVDGTAVGRALLAIAPKGDGVILGSTGAAPSLRSIDLEPGHPEVSASSLFGKVWYEGDATPQYTYQAATGEDTAETKYSQVPLLFGTIKSTFFAMLFATPLAVLAALYTSEFLHPRVRNTVKPVVEMMASLPSVVLGFLAALLIAPLVRDYLPSVLLAFFIVPVTVLLAAYLWQLVPIQVRTRMNTRQHLALTVALVLLGAGISIGAGRVLERWLFTPSVEDVLVMAGSVQPVPREQWPEALRDRRVLEAGDVRPFRASGFYYRDGTIVRPAGSIDALSPEQRATIAANRLDQPDLRAWADGVIGTPAAGWTLVLTPVGILLVALSRRAFLDPVLARNASLRIGAKAAGVEVLKFLCTLMLGIAAAVVLASLFSAAGLDARDSVLGTYAQRNTLVVAIVMGFAIIPIIYTISEDALSAVPRTLRSASLGCGATRWQTATRVVLPVALSGIFSAVMIGLGRAAGETMIVLMATGNTPNMDWNIFSGFRTLSANIATEMPEAAQHSTHYRVLFVSAVCLFLLTFVVNTVAEVVRQRVRRRAAAL